MFNHSNSSSKCTFDNTSLHGIAAFKWQQGLLNKLSGYAVILVLLPSAYYEHLWHCRHEPMSISLLFSCTSSKTCWGTCSLCFLKPKTSQRKFGNTAQFNNKNNRFFAPYHNVEHLLFECIGIGKSLLFKRGPQGQRLWSSLLWDYYEIAEHSRLLALLCYMNNGSLQKIRTAQDIN